MVKNVAPQLMKGIGIKTMEKLASKLVTTWIPYVNVLVPVLEGLYNLFKDDPEEVRLRQMHAEQQRAHERAVQQMEDFARELAEGFDGAMQAEVRKASDEFFSELGGRIDEMRASFSQSEQENSRRLEALLAAQRQAAQA